MNQRHAKGLKHLLIEKTVQTSSALIRRLPIRRKIPGAFIKLSLCFRDYHFDFAFRCPRINVTWSAAGFPDLLTRHILFGGLYQEDVLVSLCHVIRKGDVIFDVGGHHGLMAIVSAMATGRTGKVVTFEPNPHARAYIEKHLLLNRAPDVSDVVIESVALSSQKGESLFYIQSGEMTWNSTILKEFAPSETSISVTTTTMDDYVSRTGLIPRVIKIDTEGSDFMVLQGARETLIKHKPVLIVEFNPISAQAAGVTLSEYIKFLEKLGYELAVLKRSFLGRYKFNEQEPFCEARHTAANGLANVVCIPTH